MLDFYRMRHEAPLLDGDWKMPSSIYLGTTYVRLIRCSEAFSVGEQRRRELVTPHVLWFRS